MKKLAAVLAAFLAMETAYFLFVETNDIEVTVCRVRDARLAAVLGEVRVAQITDLHTRRLGYREKKLVGILDRLRPDIVFVTGDFVPGQRGIAPGAELMRRIARGRTVVGVLGNNDHSSVGSTVDTALLVAELQKAGVHVLRNKSLKLTIHKPGNTSPRVLYAVGVDDNFMGYDDIFAALRNVPPAAPKILLAHAPVIVEKIDTTGISLILSGHTHGGQIIIPFIGALYLNPGFRAQRRFVSGIYHDDTRLYVNRGIGTVLLPLRLFCRPEITVFEFVP